MKQKLLKMGKVLRNSTLLGLVVHMMTAFLPVRRAEMSSFINFSSQRASVGFFGSGEFMYSGGVVPRGLATFLRPDGTRINGKDLGLAIINKSKFANRISDFDAIGIKYGNEVYKISMDDKLLYPLMKFVKSGTYTAYTIPPNYDAEYFRKKEFVEWNDAYVAREFEGHELFLDAVDLDTEIESLPLEMEKKIVQSFDTLYSNRELNQSKSGSYINADFHITYQVFLETMDGEKVADIAGLPLRYYYGVNSSNQPIIRQVKIFQFPEDEHSLQYKSTVFFQAAAVLRYFKHKNPAEFARFMNEVAIALTK